MSALIDGCILANTSPTPPSRKPNLHWRGLRFLLIAPVPVCPAESDA